MYRHISLGNKVINIDDIECQKFDKCEKCIGSKETLKCNKCKIGYILNENNLCIKAKCNIGEKEKRFSCRRDEGKENECLNCNEGYYLSIYDIDKTKCKKCQIEGCKYCNNEGICEQCKDYYEPIFNNNKIEECKLICDLGEENKCKTCDLENRNKCQSCNTGYKLMKNGTCIKIINSFIAEYNVTSTNNSIYLMNLLKNFINFSNIEMYIDDKRVFPYIIQKYRFAGIYAYPEDYYDDVFVSYKFYKLGIIRVKIIINQICKIHLLYAKI